MSVDSAQIQTTPASEDTSLRRVVAPFQGPVIRESLSQLATSFGGFFAVCAAMYVAVDISFWIALALAPLAAGFLVRIFIIQHDCGHFSFFRSRRANDAVGFACSLLTMTPYVSWRRQHAGHHGIWNDLDRRQSGADIYSSCLTVAEYRALSPGQRWWHRTTRHPLVANVLLPPLVFLVLYRFPFDTPKDRKRERRAVYVTDLALLGGLGALGVAVGFDRVVAVQLPVITVASIIGVWLFSVQHRFEETWWVRHDQWRFKDASLLGSSYLRLPRVLQWFTGNIGFHHVHHLNPRVPNYRLQDCHERIAPLCRIPVLSLRDGLRASRFILWDEDRQRMVTFRDADGRTERSFSKRRIPAQSVSTDPAFTE
jgi:omega-6 fatty acid desaturase (delta-12 desaturase)